MKNAAIPGPVYHNQAVVRIEVSLIGSPGTVGGVPGHRRVEVRSAAPPPLEHWSESHHWLRAVVTGAAVEVGTLSQAANSPGPVVSNLLRQSTPGHPQVQPQDDPSTV